jgi:transposase
MAGSADSRLFDARFTLRRHRHLVSIGGYQWTDSTLMFAAVRALNRIEVVGNTVRLAFHRLPIVVPEW